VGNKFCFAFFIAKKTKGVLLERQGGVLFLHRKNVFATKALTCLPAKAGTQREKLRFYFLLRKRVFAEKMARHFLKEKI
jgi:hypothetical protein